MILNEYGQIVYNEWAKTPEIRSNVQLDEFVVMPNHVHGIIVITNDVLHTPHDQRDMVGAYRIRPIINVIRMGAYPIRSGAYAIRSGAYAIRSGAYAIR